VDLTLVGQSLLSGLLFGGVYSLMAVGLTLIFGVMRVVNFAHGDMMVWGMYLAWLLATRAGVDPYLGFLACAAALFALGLGVQRGLVNRIVDAPHEMRSAHAGCLSCEHGDGSPDSSVCLALSASAVWLLLRRHGPPVTRGGHRLTPSVVLSAPTSQPPRRQQPRCPSSATTRRPTRQPPSALVAAALVAPVLPFTTTASSSRSPRSTS
jgi:hypothetical protein